MQDGAFRSREQPRLVVALALAATVGAFVALVVGVQFGAAIGVGAWATGLGGWLAFDAARCRSVTIARDGLTVASQRIAWSEIEDTHIRDTPRGRAGYFIRVTDDARIRLGLPAPAHPLGGFGLAAPPSATRYDFFLRADPPRLADWLDVMNLWLLVDSGKKLIHASVVLHDLTSVRARIVVVTPDSITVEVIAPSLEALADHAGRAVASVLPDTAKWDPTFTGGVMVFVGPLALANHPDADGGLARVKQAVRAQLAGTPREVDAIFAAR